MKLKHLFLASLAVCAFASCSDDSSNGIDIPEENYMEIETSLSIQASAINDVLTKSGETEGGSTRERYVNELTAYLFYAEGANEDAYPLAAMKTAKASDYEGKLAESNDVNGVDRVEDIVVKVKAEKPGELSPTVLKIVLLANVPSPASYATLGDLKAATLTGIGTYSFEDVNINTADNYPVYLPMFSQIITVGDAGKTKNKAILAGTDYDNWVLNSENKIQYTNQPDGRPAAGDHYECVLLGGEWKAGTTKYEIQTPSNSSKRDDRIPLTRHMARVQLEALDCSFTQNYEDASFTLTDVYIANAGNTSLLYGDATAYSLENASTYSHGCAYSRDDYFLVKSSDPVGALAKSGYNVVINNKENDHAGNVVQGEINYGGQHWKKFNDRTLTSGSTNLPNMAQFYVFEMQGNKSMTPDAVNDQVPVDQKIQTMLILKGTWANGSIKKENRYYRIPIAEGGSVGVKRNTIYKVYATITGEGSKDPDTSELNACVSFSVKVEPWEVIRQYEDDVN